jgi:hypothetical protein
MRQELAHTEFIVNNQNIRHYLFPIADCRLPIGESAVSNFRL